MKNITVELLHITPLEIAKDAIRNCWQSQEKSDNMGDKDIALMDRIANKYKHSSTIEHITVNFHIKGFSRALLQELSRHRLASPSVKSTRYTLKELKDDSPFISDEEKKDWLIVEDNKGVFSWLDIDRASKYVVLTGHELTDATIVISLSMLKDLIDNGVSNDIAKYALPEAYRTESYFTINFRSLKNLLSLRTDKSALKEFQLVAHKMYESIPEKYKFLLEDSINDKI